jgi:hypothetical protein
MASAWIRNEINNVTSQAEQLLNNRHAGLVKVGIGVATSKHTNLMLQSVFH